MSKINLTMKTLASMWERKKKTTMMTRQHHNRSGINSKINGNSHSNNVATHKDCDACRTDCWTSSWTRDWFV